MLEGSNNMVDNFLYRGVSLEMHRKNCGILMPKDTNFKRTVCLDQGFHLDQGVTLDESVENAVVAHQVNSTSFPTSGISTTPHYDRAQIYATYRSQKGIIYKLDRDTFLQYDVKEYIVKDFTSYPQIPEDDEVILVHEDLGYLPKEIIVDTIEVTL